MSERKSLVSDTPVTLLTGFYNQTYDEWEDLKPVGEFVTRPWCRPHNDWFLFPLLDACQEGVRIGDYGNCESVDRLVEVIPDDH